MSKSNSALDRGLEHSFSKSRTRPNPRVLITLYGNLKRATVDRDRHFGELLKSGKRMARMCCRISGRSTRGDAPSQFRYFACTLNTMPLRVAAAANGLRSRHGNRTNDTDAVLSSANRVLSVYAGTTVDIAIQKSAEIRDRGKRCPGSMRSSPQGIRLHSLPRGRS